MDKEIILKFNLNIKLLPQLKRAVLNNKPKEKTQKPKQKNYNLSQIPKNIQDETFNCKK